MSLLAKSLSRPTLKSSVSRSRTVSVQARRTVKPSKGSTPDSAWVSLALRGRPKNSSGIPLLCKHCIRVGRYRCPACWTRTVAAYC